LGEASQEAFAATSPRVTAANDQTKNKMPPSSARSMTRTQAPQELNVVLSANWGMIAFLLAASPWFFLFCLNPVSLFLAFFAAASLCFLTFVPKIVYFLLLEIAIARGRAGQFFEQNHERRVRGVYPRFRFNLQYVEALATELASIAGGVESAALKEVAIVRRRYPDGPLSFPLIGARVAHLPFVLVTQAKNHAIVSAQIAYTAVMRFVALNIIAKLYSKSAPTDR